MFHELPHTFRKHQLAADVRQLLILQRAMKKGLVNTLGDIYLLMKGLITNAPTDFGPFTAAFYEYFLDIPVKRGEPLAQAIERSKTFEKWRKQFDDTHDGEAPDLDELVEQFLDEVHTTTFDIKKILNGKDILEKDNPDMVDNPDGGVAAARNLDKIADYTDVSLEELLERMKRVAAQQREKHRGGQHWIGTGGNSPYGHGGAAMGGVRVGGAGGGKMARKVMNSHEFYPVDTKAILQDDNIDAALAALKGIEEGTAELRLDIPTTINEGLKQGGIFLPYEEEIIHQKMQVILLIDNGGWSMSPYVRSVKHLFSKMKTRFAHDLKTYYFHNTIYNGAYTDPQRRQFEHIDKITKLDKNYCVFVIGDADMAPYELYDSSIADWQRITKHFKRVTWLNPLQKRSWEMSYTVSILREIFPMFRLTPEGIQEAVLEMNKKRSLRCER